MDYTRHKNVKKNYGFFKTLKQNSLKRSTDDDDDDDDDGGGGDNDDDDDDDDDNDDVDNKTEVGF